MKITKLLVLIWAISLNPVCAQQNNVSNPDFPTLENRYLGQKSPGIIPELFAPDIIRTEFREGAYAFTPDLKEFYFRRRGGVYKNNTLVVIQYKNNEWTESIVEPGGGEPFISSNGTIMHLGRKYKERTKSGWSETKKLGAPFQDIPIMRFTTSDKGTAYFDEATETGPIRYSRLIDGIYQKLKVVDIDMGNWNAHPFIAPDESYLIWDDKKEGGFGDSDLYISFRQQDGSWGTAINLGDQINTKYEDAYGTITPDGKYFFFVRSYGGDKADIYWVDAKIIETLRPQ
ncbi:hypothetical protein [Aquimarina algiphila]|uniref:hypothetical protein n=1 Tax=Aquimarina algiphila TaxID=2047982 RepID=UPI002490C7EC|nr:hypothetical protein [Aquimarina algiphila]